jgi:hypothetical protein
VRPTRILRWFHLQLQLNNWKFRKIFQKKMLCGWRKQGAHILVVGRLPSRWNYIFLSVQKNLTLQLLRKFRVHKFYPKLRGFEPKLRVFRTKTSFFLPEIPCFWKPEFRVFKPKLFVLQRIFFFILPKLRVLIPGFFATETSEYQIQTKFLTF